MNRIFPLAFVAIASLAAPLAAQVVYEPVRYQYGQYGEIYYGGSNPNLVNHGYIYLPPSLQAAYAAQRLNTPSYVNGYAPNGTTFASPYLHSSSLSSHPVAPIIFSDYLPFTEVGQFGYTTDDARNEAYNNVPRIQTTYQPPAPSPSDDAQVSAPVAAPSPPTDPRVKVIPLLNWAKMERTRNPQLYSALIQEARKLDPDATARLEHSLAQR